MPTLLAASTRASADLSDTLLPRSLRRLAEIDDELTRISGGQRASQGDSLRARAADLEGARSLTTPAEAWRTVTTEARRAVTQTYGRLAGAGEPGGLSLPAAGSLVDLVGRVLFGLDEHLDAVDVMPRLAGIADDQTWELHGWLLGTSDTLDLVYRPRDRAATVRLAAARGWRLALRFPWLTESGCVMARRGPETERLLLVPYADGGGYVDVRATFDAALVRVSAQPCP